MSRPLYELRGVQVRRGGRLALALEALELERGGVTALVGPNGAGKTTLLRVLGFLQPPEAGELRYEGALVGPADGPALRLRVGFVAQSPYLFRGDVRANVELGLRLRGIDPAERARRVDAVLERLGLQGLAARPARGLSGGESQRVALARALASGPRVLLLDEPFAHLDADGGGSLLALIGELGGSGETTLVFSTHEELRARAVAGRVVGLLEGRLGPASLVNAFRGRLDPATQRFHTGRLTIQVPDHVRAGCCVAIDPAHVVLSAGRLDSTMRNSFEGRLVGLAERGGELQVTVEAGERFHALVTHAALADPRLSLGSRVWVSFKSNAVQVF